MRDFVSFKSSGKIWFLICPFILSDKFVSLPVKTKVFPPDDFVDGASIFSVPGFTVLILVAANCSLILVSSDSIWRSNAASIIRKPGVGLVMGTFVSVVGGKLGKGEFDIGGRIFFST